MLSIVTVVAPGGGEEVDAGEEEEWEQVVSAHVEALVCCARSRAAWLQGALQRISEGGRGARKSAMASHENMTLCHDRCESGCKTYAVPLSKCFSPPRLWPDDPQWGSHDVRDDCINSTYFRRTFFKTSDGSCGNKSSGFELPIGACVGPFGKPRPWGVFHLNCAADPWAAAVDTLSSASNKSFHSLVSPLSVMVKLSYTATTGSYFNKSEANATVDGWERSFTANPAVGMRALLFAQNATRRRHRLPRYRPRQGRLERLRPLRRCITVGRHTHLFAA